MKLTNAQIYNSVEVLSRLNETGMLGYAIAKNRKKLIEEVKEYSEKRDELLTLHGESVGDGKFTLSKEAAKRFVEDLRPFAELTVDVPVMQVPQSVFVGGTLTSEDMFVLDWMVQDNIEN